MSTPTLTDRKVTLSEGDSMADATIEVSTGSDGTVMIKLHGVLGAANAVELRRTVVHAVRRSRPVRLVIDLNDVAALDAINLGSLAAACQLGDDHNVAVSLDHCPTTIADRLLAAGVSAHRLRYVTSQPTLPAGNESEDPISPRTR